MLSKCSAEIKRLKNTKEGQANFERVMAEAKANKERVDALLLERKMEAILHEIEQKNAYDLCKEKYSSMVMSLKQKY